jgi:hypothetical protein
METTAGMTMPKQKKHKCDLDIDWIDVTVEEGKGVKGNWSWSNTIGRKVLLWLPFKHRKEMILNIKKGFTIQTLSSKNIMTATNAIKFFVSCIIKKKGKIN